MPAKKTKKLAVYMPLPLWQQVRDLQTKGEIKSINGYVLALVGENVQGRERPEPLDVELIEAKPSEELASPFNIGIKLTPNALQELIETAEAGEVSLERYVQWSIARAMDRNVRKGDIEVTILRKGEQA